jgi:hypothetical protein
MTRVFLLHQDNKLHALTSVNAFEFTINKQNMTTTTRRATTTRRHMINETKRQQHGNNQTMNDIGNQGKHKGETCKQRGEMCSAWEQGTMQYRYDMTRHDTAKYLPVLWAMMAVTGHPSDTTTSQQKAENKTQGEKATYKHTEQGKRTTYHGWSEEQAVPVPVVGCLVFL